MFLSPEKQYNQSSNSAHVDKKNQRAPIEKGYSASSPQLANFLKIR